MNLKKYCEKKKRYNYHEKILSKLMFSQNHVYIEIKIKKINKINEYITKLMWYKF